MIEAEFNRYAAEEFIGEYYREVGQLYRFKRLGQPFPDVILESPAHREVGVEFVSVVLAFVNQEQRYFDRYRREFLAALRTHRSRYSHVMVTLQPHHLQVLQPRPMRLPDIKSPDGRQLVADFVQLLDERFEDLSTVWSGKDGGALLDRIRNSDGTLSYPVLSRYFGAILFHHMTDHEISATVTPDDQPVIRNPVIWYSSTEIVSAVRRALTTKSDKGPAYSCDILLIHILQKPGAADVSDVGVHATEFIRLGRTLLADTSELTTRFGEIWFLDRHTTDGRRLYRLY